MERVYFVGPGRMGMALGYALWQADAAESLTYSGRRPDPPSHPLFVQGIARYEFGLERPAPGTTVVVLTVPDDVLPEMAHALAGQGDGPPGCAAFHCSGALSTDVLAPLHARGYDVGSLHPLQSIAHPVTGADLLPGSAFAVSGGREASAVARRLVAALGGVPLTVPVTGRPLYHAAAVTVSNHLTALVAMAGRLLVRAGVPEAQALPALLPLARGTLENLETMGVGPSLTGPVQRGDVETVLLHLRAMEPRDRAVYTALGREMVELASAFGLADEVAERLGSAFDREEEGR
ncbi:MAG: DUF2520 domain-containing protein [Gemmatimonadetes bacterium]|nr:DUF2520 domain-containing protein [Gemmatimonadota bacterium]